MKVICEIVCSKCGRKQNNPKEIWYDTLFWQPCELCNRYGLYRVTRQKFTSLSDWLTALYHAMDFQRIENSILVNKDK